MQQLHQVVARTCCWQHQPTSCCLLFARGQLRKAVVPGTGSTNRHSLQHHLQRRGDHAGSHRRLAMRDGSRKQRMQPWFQQRRGVPGDFGQALQAGEGTSSRADIQRVMKSLAGIALRKTGGVIRHTSVSRAKAGPSTGCEAPRSGWWQPWERMLICPCLNPCGG